jgi:diaminopimelate decarboxylase
VQPALLKLLASLGAGFDCASKAELEAVLAMGVPKDRIIFAHPCKRACDLRFARDAGIQMTTFDTESELNKLASVYPGIKLVLRVRCDDPEVSSPARSSTCVHNTWQCMLGLNRTEHNRTNNSSSARTTLEHCPAKTAELSCAAWW